MQDDISKITSLVPGLGSLIEPISLQAWGVEGGASLYLKAGNVPHLELKCCLNIMSVFPVFIIIISPKQNWGKV